MTFPDLKTIPKHYFKPSDRPGTLEILIKKIYFLISFCYNRRKKEYLIGRS